MKGFEEPPCVRGAVSISCRRRRRGSFGNFACRDGPAFGQDLVAILQRWAGDDRDRLERAGPAAARLAISRRSPGASRDKLCCGNGLGVLLEQHTRVRPAIFRKPPLRLVVRHRQPAGVGKSYPEDLTVLDSVNLAELTRLHVGAMTIQNETLSASSPISIATAAPFPESATWAGHRVVSERAWQYASLAKPRPAALRYSGRNVPVRRPARRVRS
jgi:hypothetical protein